MNVYQQGDNDCLSACLATLLECELAKVPVWTAAHWNEQLALAQAWLAEIKYTMVAVDVPEGRFRYRWPGSPQTTPVRCILVVYSETEPHGHAVVGRLHQNRLKIIHDPDRETAVGKHHRCRTVLFLVPLL